MEHIDQYTKFITEAQDLIDDAGKLNDPADMAVMYVDIINFQLVNNFYGYTEGDRFLKACLDMLSSLPGTKLCARVFSDHFIRLVRIEKDDDINAKTKDCEARIREFLEQQYTRHPNCRMEIAGGYCMVQNGANGLIQAIDDANLARKEAKSQGITSVIWFDNVIRRKIKERQDMEVALQSALANEEFIFFLQPKVCLHTGRIVGAEALARWRKRDGSILYPDAFIPLLEHNGSIVELDFLIYRRVCEYLKKRMDAGWRVVPVSVNMSRINIYKNDFAESLHEIAVYYHIPPSLLEFEITETVLLYDFDGVEKAMNRLRSYGYRVSVDDYGSGYTGVNIWKNLNFDILKLDKSLVSEDGPSMHQNDTVITSIAYIGKMRQVILLCEGVETLDQCRHMKELGFETAQGYYFSKPVSQEEFDRLLDEDNGCYPADWLKGAGKNPLIRPVEEMEKTQLDNFYREIYDSVDCAIIQYQEDPDRPNAYRCISLNRYAVLLYGFQSREEALADGGVDIVNDFILREDIETHIGQFQQLNHAGDSILLDFRIRRGDGELRSLTGCVKIIINQKGERIFLGVLMDKSGLEEVEALRDKLNTVMENTPGDVVKLKIKGHTLENQYLTTGLAKTFGYTKDHFSTIVGEDNGLQLLAEEERAGVLEKIFLQAQKRAPLDITFQVVYHNGKKGWHNLKADYGYETEAGEKVYHGIITNVTQIKKQEEALALSEKRYRIAAEILQTDIWIYNFETERLLLPVTERFSALELQGHTEFTLEEFLEGGHIHPDHLDTYLSIYQRISNGEKKVTVELMARLKTTEYHWFLMTCEAITWGDNGTVVEFVGVSRDIHEEKLKQKNLDELKDRVQKDALTGLLNREAAQRKIDERLSEAVPFNRVSAFLMLDLDNFKNVNDICGHQEGDRVLHRIAGLISRTLPENSIAGRFGGDEFIIYIHNARYESDIHKIAENICAAVRNGFGFGSDPVLTVPVTISIGIAFCQQGCSFSELYQRADEAMYCAKRTNKDKYCVWKDPADIS